MNNEKSFSQHLLNKFIFPKTFIFDDPGIILNKNVSRFGGRESFTRVVFLFGDLLVNLYKETVVQLGKEGASKLWEKIGREMGLRYVSFSGKRYFSKEIQLKSVESVFSALKAAGLGDFKLKPLSNSLNFFIECKNSFFMEELGEDLFFEGLFSGIFSGIFSRNFECKFFSFEQDFKKFEVFIGFEENNFFEGVCCDKNYLIKNRCKKQNFFGKNYSLKDFFKFNEVFLDKEFNFWRIGNYSLFPSEVGLFGLIFKNYSERGYDEIFKRVYVSFSEKIFLDLLGKKILSQRIKYFCHFLSALGWGIPNLKVCGTRIKLSFFYLPFCRYGVLDKAYFFNGLLNAVFEKEYSFLFCSSAFHYCEK